jgi:transposase InsO family protein
VDNLTAFSFYTMPAGGQSDSTDSASPSMSRIGNPYDNAKAESFMKTLKQEEPTRH